jgi:hypothetical protein
MALEQFAEQGMPVYPDRFGLAVTRVARLPRIGEAPKGPHGGRGYFVYEIPELQLLHAGLVRWLTVTPPGDT